LEKKQKKENTAYRYFIAPGLVLYTGFVMFPIACSVIYSLFQWSGIGPMQFVGFRNFQYLLFGERMSGVFFHALKNNFIYLLCVLFIITPIQIFTAYLFFVKIPLTKYIRTMIFVPYVLSISIVGFFALLVFEGNTGILNEMITNTLGVQYTRAWLGDDKVMFPVFILVVIWQCASSGTMIFFADMQATPKEVIEASIVDGCGELSCFFHIILPGIRASLVTNLTLSVIYAMTMFGLPYVLVGTSGGVNNRLDFIAMVFYRYAFGGTYYGTTDIGFGSAISVVMLIIILFVWGITNLFLGKMKEQ
jgi:ABC transporter, permease protein